MSLRNLDLGRTAEQRLRHLDSPALRNVCCVANDGIIYLRGCVPTYHLRQTVQDLMSTVEGVNQVVNQIDVFALSNSPPLGHDPTEGDQFTTDMAIDEGASLGAFLERHPTASAISPR